jgi:hypothetical protein
MSQRLAIAADRSLAPNYSIEVEGEQLYLLIAPEESAS